mmetsp:Transcript_31336/g.102632  ORF Transcript_31336/g.102632 Transcript_31336/m.102632 type:complete len:321 (-) Transcript_31336:66-1028(-)
MGRAHADYAVLAPPPEHSNTRRLRRVQLLKRVLDCLISALALAAAALALHGIDSTSKLPFKTFAPPSLSSAIIFFGGPSPPPVRGFLLCTVGAWLVGAAITTASPLFGPDNDTRAILSAATLLFYFKMSGEFFVPTFGLASALLTAQAAPVTAGPLQALRFLVSPWLAGHCALYAAAAVASRLRRQARVRLKRWEVQLGLRAGGALGRERDLRSIFARFDTSGNGFLEAGELKYALKAATGLEPSLEDCETLISMIDTDGDHVLALHEFVQLVTEEDLSERALSEAAKRAFSGGTGSLSGVPEPTRSLPSRGNDTHQVSR